jgi:hypothetical protein
VLPLAPEAASIASLRQSAISFAHRQIIFHTSLTTKSDDFLERNSLLVFSMEIQHVSIRQKLNSENLF